MSASLPKPSPTYDLPNETQTRRQLETALRQIEDILKQLGYGLVNCRDGLFGIGTSLPGYLLDVVGNANATITSRVRNNNSGASSYAMMGVNAYGNSWGWRIGSTAANGNAFELVLEAFGTPSVKMVVTTTGKFCVGSVVPTSPIQVPGLPVYANNAAAVAGGLTAGAFYRTGADPDPVCVVH